MPTPEQLAALPYGGPSAFAKGLTAEDYRREYREHGHRLRWWRNYPAPPGAVGPNGEQREVNGRIYVEQNLPSTVRCLSYRTERQLNDENFGVIETGATAIAVLPDEVWLRPYDRVAFPDVFWPHCECPQRGGGASDSFALWPVRSIAEIRRAANGALINPNAYAISADKKHIEWQSGAISEGEFYLVEYFYEPRFEFQVQEQSVMQIGSDGKYLPQRGTLRIVPPSEIENYGG
jgi:hypothetical protein